MNTKKTKILICFSTLFLLFFTGSITAAADDANASQTVKVGYIDYGGFIDLDENGYYYGYCVDYLNEISNYTGWKYEYIHDTFANLLKALKTGEIDMLCQTQKTPEREQDYLFSDYQVGVEIAALYVLDQNSDGYYYDDAESLDGMLVAMMEGSAQNDMFAEYAKEKGFTYHPIYYTTVEACFEAVRKGEADGLVMGSLAGQDKDGLRVAGRFSSDPYYVMTGKGNSQLLDKINQAQYELTLQQPYLEAALYQKYYEETAAFSGILFTRQEGKWIEQHPDLTLALRSDSIPLSDYSTESGGYGILADLLDKIGENAGLHFMYTQRSDSMTSEAYLEKQEDCATIGVFTNAVSQAGYVFSDPIYQTTVALVGPAGLDFSFEEKEQTGRSIAVPKANTRLIQYLKTNFPQYTIHVYDSNADCLKAVAGKKAEFTALTLDIATNLLDDPHFRNLMIINASFLDESYCVAVKDTRENRLLISIINKSYRSLSSEAVEQIQINHATRDRYESSLKDIWYLYRYPLLFVGILILAVFALLISYVLYRSRSVRKLQLAAQKADQASQAKSEFLARMSHDIRTPLNAVLGYAKLAKEDVNHPKDQLKDLNQIEESGSFLLSLVNDVLDMSKIESETIEMNPEPILLESFVEQICTLFQEKVTEKNITLHREEKDAPVCIQADKIRFKQIFFNLLSNAVKFTEKNGNIWFTITGEQASDQKVWLSVSVKDDGIGMSEDFKDHVFDTFAQEHTSASGMEGSGLGLSIVKKLVDLMNGQITVKSRHGEGTEFVVVIPVEVVDRKEEDFWEKTTDRTFLNGKKALLCEDHDVNAALVMRLLEKVGIETVRAENGAKGIEIFTESQPGEFDVILMDIRMPVLDGNEAARQIRQLKRPDAAAIPIIALTANAYVEDRKETRKSGMNAHLSKPINPNELYNTITDMIQQKL